MEGLTISPYIDRYHPQQNGKCSVTIRVTFQGKRRYYPTGLTLTPGEFDRTTEAKRRKEAEKAVYGKLQAFINKANEVADKLPVFTFNKFEDLYLAKRKATNTVSAAFEEYASELREENRIGTAISYECAMNSIDKFAPDIKFADVTRSFLLRYENWMLQEGNSRTTVGIYLRSLRSIYNRANIDRSLYPFGEGKAKYAIPTGRNIKKALTLEEVAKIFDYEAEIGSMEEMARDYWIFIYLCNGMNVKDFCLLKRKNVDGDILTYEREKTKRSKREGQKIIVSLKPDAKSIISKWGIPSITPDSFLFPHVKKEDNPERVQRIVQQVTQNINKHMKEIAKKLEINKEVTTYFARHSFATILKRTGASVEMIGELLGHSDTKTTRNYLAGFETDAIHRATDVLTSFKKAQ